MQRLQLVRLRVRRAEFTFSLCLSVSLPPPPLPAPRLPSVYRYALPRALARFVPFVAAQHKKCRKPLEFYQYSNSLCFSTCATMNAVHQLVWVYAK